MKKLLSAVVVLAMLISCFCMISVFAAENSNILSEEESTFTGLTEVPSSWGKQGNSPVMTIAEDPTESGNKVMQFTSTKAWESPKINIAQKIKAAMDESNLTEAEFTISMRLYAVEENPAAVGTKALARLVLRSHNEFSFLKVWSDGNIYTTFSSAGTAYNTWYNLTGTIQVTAADMELFTQTADLDLCLDSLSSSSGTSYTFFIDDVTVAFSGEKETEVKTVVNGNAEEGTTGWGSFSQGKGEIAWVEGGANGTAHAIKFTPSNSAYASIAFDLGPAIIQDEANGYNGAGAGEYTISFWAKTDSPAPENTKFKVVLNSQTHVNADKEGQINGLEGDGYVSSYISGAEIELTDQWKEYEAKIKVSDAYLKTIKALYAADNTNAYQLILRLDGANSGDKEYAFGKPDAATPFVYYVDEVAISQAQGEQPTEPTNPEEPAKTEGVTIKVDSIEDGSEVYVRFQNFTGHIGNGKMTVKVYNTGSRDITVRLEARIDDETVWTNVATGQDTVIAAGKVAELSVACPDTVTSEKDGKVKTPFMLLLLKDAKAGDSLTVYGFSTESMDTQKPSQVVTTGKASLSFGVTTQACPTGDVLPVAMITAAAAACVMLGIIVTAKKKRETV